MASAIRSFDLIGKHLLTNRVEGSWRLTEAELEAREAYLFYRDHAKHTGDNDIFGDALNTSWTWIFQFNHAAISFIRSQSKGLGLTLLAEEALEIRETVGVH